MAPRIEPGTEWVLRRGHHSGTVVEVEGQTFAGSVQFRVVKKGNSTGSSWEDDSGRVHTKPRDEFLTLYEKSYKALGPRTQPAFRQNNMARKLKQMTIEGEVQAAQPVQAPPPSNGLAKHYVSQGDTRLSVNVQLITPDQARAWLDRGGANRKLSESRVKKLVMAIQLGEWQLTGDSIKLDADGKVRDGQHRLEAIYRSNTPVQALVVRNVTEAAFDVIDTGKTRIAADVLAIHGHISVTALAATVRGLILIERNGSYTGVGGSALAPSNAAVLAYADSHPEVNEGVRLADKLRKDGRFIGGTGLWGIALTMFWRVNARQAEVFVDSLIEGANLEPGSPILKLRNMYRGSTRMWQSNNENRERLLATVIKGWNAWRRDELVQQLSWHNTGRSAEKFPVAE